MERWLSRLGILESMLVLAPFPVPPAVSSAAATSADVAGKDDVTTGIGELERWEPQEEDIMDWFAWLAEE